MQLSDWSNLSLLYMYVVEYFPNCSDFEVHPGEHISTLTLSPFHSRMAAPECIPLVLEPESKFYTDPVVVLDFQSLYPSMVIAYNYCFSTCMGRVRNLAV